MEVKFLLTPSSLIQGLPRPIPKQGETADLDEGLALRLIRGNIAEPVQRPTPKRKIKAVAAKPAIAETKTDDDKQKDKD